MIKATFLAYCKGWNCQGHERVLYFEDRTDFEKFQDKHKFDLLSLEEVDDVDKSICVRVD